MFLHKSYGICNLLFDQIPDFFKKNTGLNNIFYVFHTFSTFGPLLGPPGARSISVCASMLYLGLPLALSWPRLAPSRPNSMATWLNLAASWFNLTASRRNFAPFPLNLASPRPDSAPHRFNFAAYWQSLALSWRNLVQFWPHLA